SMLQGPHGQQKSLVGPTYAVTIAMLVIGQVQVSAVMEIKSVKEYLAKRYFFNLIQFFISFLSIQLYGFFYRMIVNKSIWVRILAGLWTVRTQTMKHAHRSRTYLHYNLQYQVNTLSIMKPAKHAPHFCLAVSFVFTYLMMLISAIYGYAARNHKRGLFISRHKLILWSERLFVVTCFGIIVSAEIKNVNIEFPTLLVYTLMSNVFVVIFAASLRRPNFYHRMDHGDYILIGQLYYLNYFALYMSIVWTTASFLQIMKWDIDLLAYLTETNNND
ncbi:hypothetical protein KR038_003627, partial [Drosophila bunnanda]